MNFWDLNGEKIKGKCFNVKSRVLCIAFSTDFMAMGTLSGKVSLYKLNTYTLHKELTGHTKSVNDVIFSVTFKHLFSGSSDLTIREWDPSKGIKLRTLCCRSICYTLLINEIEEQLISGHNDGIIRIWSQGDENPC